ncbi:MAG: hypothetical protein ACQESR_01780 [Planctomycetota bacterium]
MESCPTQAVLPLVGLAADKVIRDRYIMGDYTLKTIASYERLWHWPKCRVGRVLASSCCRPAASSGWHRSTATLIAKRGIPGLL